MSIGVAINLIRESKGISQYKLAKDAGITQTMVSEIIKGKNTNPRIETVKKIAKGLGVDTSELLKAMETQKIS